MAQEKTNTNQVVLLEAVAIAFAQGLFEASSFEDGGKAKFNTKFIFDEGSKAHKALQSAVVAVAKAKWGEKAKTVLAKQNSNEKDRVIRDGGLVSYDGFEGRLYVSASSDTRPSVFNRDRTPIVEADGIIYSGCIVNARIEVWPQDNKWGKAVRTRLLGVQFVKDGDRFSGGSAPASADDFPELEDAGEALDDDDDLFGDDDIPF